MTVTINGTNGLVFADNSTQATAASGFGFKNRIINGAMMIDQRNAGASVTPTDGQYVLDRWQAGLTQTGKYSVQQSTNAPVGFVNSMLCTSLSAYSIGSGDIFAVAQKVEGLNVSDLAWGTANAKTVTLSFQVYSSLTGTFGGALRNSALNRSYPFSYTVSAANTWTPVSVTIAGDTSGTWLTSNGIGIWVSFSLGSGSTYAGTAGSWASASYVTSTGSTSVVGTNGATFYITGVQLEKGSTATSFDYRPYGSELALCQRYCPVWKFPSANSSAAVTFVYSSTTAGPFVLTNPVPVRSPVTGLTVSSASHFSVSDGDSAAVCSSVTVSTGAEESTACNWGTSGGRTSFRAHIFYPNTSGAYIIGNGCEL